MATRMALAALVLAAGVAQAQVFNGYNMVYRNFNDFATSTIDVNGAGTPSSIAGTGAITFRETHAQLSPGNFANRHFAWFSTDGGATPYALQANQSFVVRTTLRMTTNMATGIGTGAGGTVMEGGPWYFLGGGPADGGTWAITNQTIFSTGAGRPFTLISEGNGNVTDPNSPVFPFWNPANPLRIEYIYVAPGDSPNGMPGVLANFTDTVTGVTRSTGWGGFVGAEEFTGFTAGTLVGLRFQGGRNPALTTVNEWNYSNTEFLIGVPTPGAAAVLGLGALVAGRRRR